MRRPRTLDGSACSAGRNRFLVGARWVASIVAVTASFTFGVSQAAAGTSPPLIAFDDYGGVFEVQPGAPQTAHLVAQAGVYPVFSPNGMQLAYELGHGQSPSDPNLTNTIVVANRNGSDPRTILSGSEQWNGAPDSIYMSLAWSPDGKEIAYGCDGNGLVLDGILQGTYAQVCEVNVDTGAHRMITQPTTNTNPLIEPRGPDYQRLTFTPDGNDIIAMVCPTAPPDTPCADTGFPAIGAINVATGAVRVLAPNYGEAPALSPNGEQILYYHPKLGTEAYPLGGLYIMNVDGSGQRELISQAHIAAEEGAIFSPDGKDILYTAYSNEDAYHQQAFAIPMSGVGTPHMYTTGDYNVYDMDWTGLLTTCTVPNLRNKTLAQAKRLLARAACSLGKVTGAKSHQSARHIVKQSLKANIDEPAGTKVNVTLK